MQLQPDALFLHQLTSSLLQHFKCPPTKLLIHKVASFLYLLLFKGYPNLDSINLISHPSIFTRNLVQQDNRISFNSASFSPIDQINPEVLAIQYLSRESQCLKVAPLYMFCLIQSIRKLVELHYLFLIPPFYNLNINIFTLAIVKLATSL
jgi:hypothetical protein